MKPTQLIVGHTWDGEVIGPDEQVIVDLTLSDRALNVEIDAPFHNDPVPSATPGSLEGLWEFEVVEVFLRGDRDTYLELEFGPFGHYLAIGFDGYRRRQRSGLELAFSSSRTKKRWTGRAEVPAAHLPVDVRSCNAFAIHGLAEARRYLAHHPTPGAEPDFHRLESFRPLE